MLSKVHLNVTDYMLLYVLGWLMIALSPLWLPVWFGHKIHRWAIT